jgi:hypothetical protein
MKNVLINIIYIGGLTVLAYTNLGVAFVMGKK